jgi:glucose/arabinose dehydrogenase
MKSNFCLTLILVFFLFSNNLSAQNISLQTFATGFSAPVDITHAGDDKLYVVEKAGRIKVLVPGTASPSLFLDISSIVLSSGGEQGLLGLAFHPNYVVNGYFYVCYTTGTGSGSSVVARYTRSASNPLQANTASALTLLTVQQPFTNHNGGCIKFGPDGLLYISLGDGGSGGDPQNLAQNLNSRLGKLLRINVDQSSSSLNYSIPSTNPFIGTPNTQPEIWAYGLRNVWRFSFDRITGDLWMGDVGQNIWEEINRQPAGASGGQNYGWRCYEGNVVYNASGCPAMSALTPPVHVYQHLNGDCSVTGGFVYRGSQINSLWGKYIFTDYCTGLIRALTLTPNNAYNSSNLVDGSNNQHVGFGEDIYGELYVVEIQSGSILKLVDNTNCKPKAFITTPMPANCVQSVTLIALSNPSLNYQWQLNNVNISGATSSSYTASQAGIYRVIVSASNAGCQASDTSAALMFSGCPKPSITTITPSNTQATVNWTAQNCAVKYRLQYRISGTTNWISVNNLTSPSYQLNNLSASTSYQLRIRSQCNANGSWLSEWTAISTFTTLGGAVNCQPPSGQNINAVTSSTATVLWTPVSGATGYRVRYRPLGSSTWTVNLINSGTASSYVLNGLTNSTTYEVQICTRCQTQPLQLSAYSNSIQFVTPAQRLDQANPDPFMLVRVFPNPTQDNLSIHTIAPVDQDLNILIYNSMGQLILYKLVAGVNRSQTQIMDVKHLTPGIYIMEISSSDGNRQTLQFVKQ